ncbi:hypothetical protein PSA7680_00826 [Pseudoruegeria aquimaris]|uniref:DUF7742 domain-containing protein n=1 Tax=Pseudoruegeria aquimaris TaxID=393663 RepID=A0A1Y5RQ92_9RHOB|nr:hypothetical protein PSA7680_00826 [Pseudoruegeria aquimaris]
MRPVLTDDLLAALDCLMAAPPQARAGLRAQMIARAQAAEACRRRNGRMHPVFGGGSLMAAAASLQARPAVRWRWQDPQVCREAIALLRAFAAGASSGPADQPRAQSRHLGVEGSSSSRGSSIASPHSTQ